MNLWGSGPRTSKLQSPEAESLKYIGFQDLALIEALSISWDPPSKNTMALGFGKGPAYFNLLGTRLGR